MIPKVTPFEVYQKYLSLKQHFNKVDYDYFKFKGKVRANASSFENRKDKHHFVRLSKIYKEEDLTKFFVSNFVKSSDLWIGNLTSPEEEKLYLMEVKDPDLHMFSRMRLMRFLMIIMILIHFLIVWMVNIHLCFVGICGDLSIESFIIMDSILRFSSVFNQKIEESVMWPNLYSMCIKYAPFLVVNKQKYVDILKKQVELHYE